MEWRSIKEEAWNVKATNKWNIWKPLLIIAAIEFVVGLILGIAGIDPDGEMYTFVNILLNIALIPAQWGFAKYVLCLIRGQEFNLNQLKEPYGDFWTILGITVLVAIYTILGTICFIIPGIAIALSYEFVSYVYMDNPELGIKECMTKTKEMMRGHRFNFLLFGFSFIGWILIAVFTLGIGIIWVCPYITIAEAMYYDRLCGESTVPEVVETKEETEEV